MKVSAAPPPAVVHKGAGAPESHLAEIHPDLANYCAELETWALANRRDSRWDAFKYFALKAPAIASSGLAAVFAAKHWNQAATWLAACASICVLVDAINPSGQLRNAHLKAFHQLRELESRIVNDWRIGKLGGKEHDETAASILVSSQKEREKIAKELQIAETSFDRHQRPR